MYVVNRPLVYQAQISALMALDSRFTKLEVFGFIYISKTARET